MTICEPGGNRRKGEMRSVSMSVEIEFLLSYLEEELGAHEGVRVRPIAPTGTIRSIDLPQDYDPEANTLHSTRGVKVTARSRDYFFPAEWVTGGKMALVHRQAAEIREYLG